MWLYRCRIQKYLVVVTFGNKVNIELSPVSHIYIAKFNQILSNVNWNSNIFQKNMKNSIKIQLFRFALKLPEINWNINFHH